MATALDSFSRTFGAHRGPKSHQQVAKERAQRLFFNRTYAIAAFQHHHEFSQDDSALRVAVCPQKLSGSQATFALLIDADENRLLAVSEHPFRDCRYRLKGCPLTLAREAEIPRRYRAVSDLARQPTLRSALIELDLYSPEQLLGEELDVSDRGLAFLQVVAADGPPASVAEAFERAGLSDEFDTYTVDELERLGLIARPEPDFMWARDRPKDERPVLLTDHGRFVRERRLPRFSYPR